jgi:hypothetical protein
MGLNIEWRKWMASQLKITRFLIPLFFMVWPILGWCDEFIVRRISANQIEKGCNLDLHAIEDERPAIGRPDRALDLKWVCAGRSVKVIDRYEIEGGSPDVVTVLYRKNRDIIVLVKWGLRSLAADVQGDYYKIYVYRHAPENLIKPFSLRRDIMKKLGEGLDGAVNGRPVYFPCKDAASIRKALDRYGY